MKTNKLVGRLAILGIVICMLSGCSETLYREISYPSLVQTAKSQSDKVYDLKDIFPTAKTLSGIEIDTWLLNIRTMRDYNTSFVIPYKTWGPTKPGEYGMGKIGQQPFVIELFLRADGDGASFDPVSTELYINGNDKPVYPAGIFNSGGFVQCGERNGVVAATKMQIKKGVILPLANKFDVEKSASSEKFVGSFRYG